MTKEEVDKLKEGDKVYYGGSSYYYKGMSKYMDDFVELSINSSINGGFLVMYTNISAAPVINVDVNIKAKKDKIREKLKEMKLL
jgi:hypothetical protein